MKFAATVLLCWPWNHLAEHAEHAVHAVCQQRVVDMCVDLCVVCVCAQELVSIMAASKGCVLMAPPAGNAEAQKTMAGMLSAIKPKTKVGCLNFN